MIKVRKLGKAKVVVNDGEGNSIELPECEITLAVDDPTLVSVQNDGDEPIDVQFTYCRKVQ